MGPHPEAPVDVQKYIGSCLIAHQNPRAKRKSPPHQYKYGGGGPTAGPGGGGYANYAWTGVPLIRAGKPRQQQQQLPTQQRAHKAATDSASQQDSVDADLDEILPLSRLVIHAQGAPLILSPPKEGDEDGYAAFKSREFHHHQRHRVYMLVGGEEPSPAGKYHSGYHQQQEDDLPRQAASPSGSDCVSTTSEDSGASENGLPRIIKPRKRRKKDRRPELDEDPAPGGIVTLKPYQPLCYQYGDVYRAAATPKLRDPAALGTRRRDAYPYAPSARCRCPHCVPPPSTLLTPPDSPVEISDLALAVVRGRREPFGYFGPEEGLFQMEDGMVRPSSALVLTSSHPPQRPWICMADHDPKLSSCTFTVMCYNILCDKYATRQMYGYCPNWALDWTYRKTSIMQEILHYKADIISLQEVETEQFYKFFLPELKKDGYDGIFSPKSRAKTMSESERKHVDGCAIFYKSSKFFLLKEHLMEFNQLAMANAEGSDDMLNRVMTKDNIGLAALLQTRMGAYHPGCEVVQQTLLVCTAHIHWDPEYSDVKLVQTMMLMHELKSFVDDILAKCNVPQKPIDPNAIPLLLCGDFNSLPDSGVVEYLSSGRVSANHCDFKDIVYNDCLSKLGNSDNTNEFTHPFKISRAYNDGIMPFTNYSYDFKGVIDYVFYSRLYLSVLGVLGPVDSVWLDANRVQGCPHPHVPSDHFPIVVELQLGPTPPLHLLPNHHHNGISLHHR